jgi:gamma-butyrobetaine dioxygenase
MAPQQSPMPESHQAAGQPAHLEAAAASAKPQTPEAATADFQPYPLRHGIAGLDARASALEVTWDDGHASRFHYLWLRDNCRCATCRHPQTLERTFDLLTVPVDLRAESAALRPDGSIGVVWDNDGHVSVYPPGWLRAHCYSEAARAARRPMPVLWGAELGRELPAMEHAEVVAGESGLLDWLRLLRDYGVALLRDTPKEPLEVVRTTGLISYPHETNFGRDFDVESIGSPNSTAYTSLRLTSHSDLPNWRLPPGYQFLHCLENQAEGGESVLVDGFKVAETLRHEDREAFEVLTGLPLTYRFQDQEVDIVYRAPAIGLDPDGGLEEIRFSLAVMGVLDLPAEHMEAAYRAHRKLAALVRDQRFEVRFRLGPGDLLGFDNRRILHGREAFAAASGRRHLQGCYVGTDELLSRIRVLERSRQEA